MERFEMAEKLKEKAGITYEEAKAALEDSNWDMLQALVNLENAGKLNEDKKEEGKKMEGIKAQFNAKATENWFEKLVDWIKKTVEAGNRNHFVVKKDGRQVSEIPVTVAVLLFLFLHGLFMFALLVSLLMGYRFTFRSEKENEAFKQEVREAQAAAEQINQHNAVNNL